MRRCLLLLAVAAMWPGVSDADPRIAVEFSPAGVILRLDGSYAGAYYRVFRSIDPAVPAFAPLTEANVLCTGDCIVQDGGVKPGRSYQYMFDFVLPSGAQVSYGPYLVRVPERPLAARLSPNPGGGPARVELVVPGARADGAAQAEARIVDLQGRSVRVLFRGALARGVTSLTWDGRADSGRRLEAGLYFLRFDSPLGHASARIIRLP